ncbi:DUF2510 domain-containing protein [Streptomyces sp. MAR4 CNX-425]|uniref:DUF2510 domain-containing protein n=1 Tax=Streptomyces sp. MAR4 CNX-425 TaxID=3406343 RepID=UPI003B506291
MTGMAPAGWYPDPDRSDDESPRERRWDGSAWTDEVRPAAVAPDAPAAGPAGPAPQDAPPGGPPGGLDDAPTEVISGGAAPLGFGPPPGPPGAPPGPPGKGGWRGRRPLAVGIAAAVAAAALVGGGIAGGYALWGGDDGDGTGDNGPVAAGPDGEDGEPDSGDGPGGGGGTDGGSGGGPDLPDEGDEPPTEIPTEDGFATDLASGIKIPVPDGWKGQSGQIGASVSVGEYKCPTSPEDTCVRGGVNSAPALALGLDATSPKTVAEKDIGPNAEASYGDEAYGGITSHDEVESGEVTVAGEEGYLVRWKVVTEEGDDGYVQSLAFPSPANSETMVLVRAGFDIGDEAPGLGELEEITEGIEEAEGGAGFPGGGGQPVSFARR